MSRKKITGVYKIRKRHITEIKAITFYGTNDANKPETVGENRTRTTQIQRKQKPTQSHAVVINQLMIQAVSDTSRVYSCNQHVFWIELA